jgi:hypothetical protein
VLPHQRFIGQPAVTRAVDDDRQTNNMKIGITGTSRTPQHCALQPATRFCLDDHLSLYRHRVLFL